MELKVLRCFAEAFQDGVDVFKCFVDLCSHLGTCEYNFPRDKDEQDNSGFDHSVNQSWKQLRFIAAELLMCED